MLPVWSPETKCQNCPMGTWLVPSLGHAQGEHVTEFWNFDWGRPLGPVPGLDQDCVRVHPALGPQYTKDSFDVWITGVLL